MANQVCVLRFTAPDPSFGPCNPWNYADRSRLGAASVIAEPGSYGAGLARHITAAASRPHS